MGWPSVGLYDSRTRAFVTHFTLFTLAAEGVTQFNIAADRDCAVKPHTKRGARPAYNVCVAVQPGAGGAMRST
jgi:hypothetical protein